MHVAAGAYPGSFAPTVSGTTSAPITFVAEGAVTLTATVKLANVADLVLQGFAVSGAPGTGVLVSASSATTLSRLTVTGSNGFGISLSATHAVVVADSLISRNAKAGVFETAGSSADAIRRNTITDNGHDGMPYNGDGIQLAGADTTVAGNTIERNGDPGPYEHGIYAAAVATGYLIERNVLRDNAASDIKAAGAGTVRYNLLGSALFGLVLSDNSAPVRVYENVIAGQFQHAVLATVNKTPSRASLWNNTIVQTGRSTASGNAAALFVLASSSLDIRNNIVCYTNPDDLGVALSINTAAAVSSLESNNNWLCDTDKSGRAFSWSGSRLAAAAWKAATRQDAASVISAPPTFDQTFRVISTNLGACKGQPLGLNQDITGNTIRRRTPDIGAHQAPTRANVKTKPATCRPTG